MGYGRNLLINPSAETGDLTGWITANASVEAGGVEGSHHFLLGTTGYIKQSFPHTAFASTEQDFRISLYFKLNYEWDPLKVAAPVLAFLTLAYYDGKEDRFRIPLIPSFLNQTLEGEDTWYYAEVSCPLFVGSTITGITFGVQTENASGEVGIDDIWLQHSHDFSEYMDSRTSSLWHFDTDVKSVTGREPEEDVAELRPFEGKFDGGVLIADEDVLQYDLSDLISDTWAISLYASPLSGTSIDVGQYAHYAIRDDGVKFINGTRDDTVDTSFIEIDEGMVKIYGPIGIDELFITTEEVSHAQMVFWFDMARPFVSRSKEYNLEDDLPLTIAVSPEEGIKATKEGEVQFWIKADGSAYFQGIIQASTITGSTFELRDSFENVRAELGDLGEGRYGLQLFDSLGNAKVITRNDGTLEIIDGEIVIAHNDGSISTLSAQGLKVQHTEHDYSLFDAEGARRFIDNEPLEYISAMKVGTSEDGSGTWSGSISVSYKYTIELRGKRWEDTADDLDITITALSQRSHTDSYQIWAQGKVHVYPDGTLAKLFNVFSVTNVFNGVDIVIEASDHVGRGNHIGQLMWVPIEFGYTIVLNK